MSKAKIAVSRTVLLLIIATASVSSAQTSDSARVVGRQVFIEPLGVSALIPNVWIGMPDSTPNRPMSCVGMMGVDVDANIIVPENSSQLAAPPFFTRRIYSSVVDTVLPMSGLVVHIGSVGWMTTSSCDGSHVRIYVVDESAGSIHARARAVKPMVRDGDGTLWDLSSATKDSSDWTLTTVAWTFRAHSTWQTQVVFMTREVKGRTLALAMMLSASTAEAWSVFTSIVLPDASSGILPWAPAASPQCVALGAPARRVLPLWRRCVPRLSTQPQQTVAAIRRRMRWRMGLI